MNFFLASRKKLFHLQTLSRNFFKRTKNPDHWDIVTGVERWEQVQLLKGNADPWFMLPAKRGPGTKDCPNIVPAVHDKRIVACMCDKDDNHLIFWWIHEGFPRRCKCNHWFVLQRVPMPKLYEDC